MIFTERLNLEQAKVLEYKKRLDGSFWSTFLATE